MSKSGTLSLLWGDALLKPDGKAAHRTITVFLTHRSRWWQHAFPSQEHCHPLVLWCCWLGDRKGYVACKNTATKVFFCAPAYPRVTGKWLIEQRASVCVDLYIDVCKIEKQLKIAIETLEQQTASKVTVNNKAFSVHIRQQWDEYNTKKETEKHERVCSTEFLTDFFICFMLLLPQAYWTVS